MNWNSSLAATAAGSVKKCRDGQVKTIWIPFSGSHNKIKRSKKSGAGADDIYTPKLVWFSKADLFMRNVMAGRESSSNFVCASRPTGEIT